VTEIHDYMRLLWARVGVPYSPATGLPIESQTVSQMVDKLTNLPEGERLYLLAPVVRDRKGEYRKEIAEWRKSGFQRLKIDGTLYPIEDVPDLDKKFKHDIDIVVDRLVTKNGLETRYADSLETALRLADGIAVAEFGFDSHGVHKYDPAHSGVREGYIFIQHKLLQLPYRILAPKRVDGSLVPVACSASPVGFQTIRMEPVVMALGDACGIAAKTAVDANAKVRAVDVTAVQKEILKRGGVIPYEAHPLPPEGQ
jgi:hypothetical protein